MSSSVHTGRISEKCKYGCALSWRSATSHRRISGGSAAILAAASGILPDGHLFLFSPVGCRRMRAGSRALPPEVRRSDRHHLGLPVSPQGKHVGRHSRCTFRRCPCAGAPIFAFPTSYFVLPSGRARLFLQSNRAWRDGDRRKSYCSDSNRGLSDLARAWAPAGERGRVWSASAVEKGA